MLTTIGLGREIPAQHQPLTKHSKRTSSSLVADNSKQITESVNIAYRTRSCYSPIRPNSLILSSTQNSSQNNQVLTENEQITNDDNEKYYSAQSSKISTPMVYSVGSASYIRNSEEKVILSSKLHIDDEKQKIHQPKNKTFHNSHRVIEKDFLR